MAAPGKSGASAWRPPEELGEYRFEREIGRGAMGHVHRYLDTLLDRPVAVKFIAQRRPDAEARQRFLTEARAIARLTHPNVLAVHRVGEVEGHPFLVTELVVGRTVAELSKPLPSERIVSIGLDVARGLAAAHRHGVLHRDVKPSNVIVAEDGEGSAKLIDFGLAVIAEAPTEAGGGLDSTGGPKERSGSRLAGTPVYMAPETLRGEPATAKSDVYSLGAVLYEMAAGVAPRETLPEDADDEGWILGAPLPLAGPGVDPRLASIVMRCLAVAPEDRYPSAEGVADALSLLTSGPARAVPEGNPYRGLASFDAAHRGVFFGRAAESLAVVDRLRATSFAVVTGDSGVGKSSLCRAGVAPLVLEGALHDGKSYRLATVLPGRLPYTALLNALTTVFGMDVGAPEGESGAPSTRGPPPGAGGHSTDVARALQRVLGKQGGALILVDQAEELVTLSKPSEARRLAETLRDLAAKTSGVRVLLSVRGDYFTSLGVLPGMGEWLDHGLFVLRPLSPEGVRAAIVGPAAQHGVEFEPPALVESLSGAATGTPGGLPLLQFALAELWEAKKDAKVITPTLLERVGGVEGALARHADAVIDSLSPSARTSARRLLVLLVTPEGTARRRMASEMELNTNSHKKALDALIRGRLLVAREIEGETAYELAHEALLSRWERLSRWLDDSRDERRLLRDLGDAAALWERRRRRPEDTLSADELSAARSRQQKLDVVLPPDIEAFLAEGERVVSAARRKSRIQIAVIAVVAGVVTVGSLAAAGELRRQKLAAERQTESLRQAGGNLGKLDLVLRPFDGPDGAGASVDVGELPDLSFALHAVRSGDTHHPGAPIPRELLRWERVTTGAKDEFVARVEAPGGMVFLRVDGRGRRGEQCAPSWLRIQALPGYAERAGDAPSMVIRIPTCRATAASMVPVPKGPFVYGGPGEPPTKFADYVEPERTVELEGFSIDRTEVSNAAYRPFAEMERVTGYPAPKYPPEGLLGHAGEPGMPATSMDAFTAEAYCRYMGKRLPGDLEWTKAARGGLTIDGQPNPHPRRLFPWGGPTDERCANADGDADGSAWVADVTAYPCGASPYGVTNLAGNVAEWISREGQNDQDSPLRVVRGGAMNSPRELEHVTTVFRNAREARYFDFTIGLRCVAGGKLARSETWDEY